jgi:hypothetical protein
MPTPSIHAQITGTYRKLGLLTQRRSLSKLSCLDCGRDEVQQFPVVGHFLSAWLSQPPSYWLILT